MAKKNSATVRKITVIYHEVAYACEIHQIATDSLDLDKRLQCPYCGSYLAIVGETYERGKYQDKGTLRLLCRKSLDFFLYNYHVGALLTLDGSALEAGAQAAV